MTTCANITRGGHVHVDEPGLAPITKTLKSAYSLKNLVLGSLDFDCNCPTFR